MARVVLVMFGAASLAWAISCLAWTDFIAARTGIAFEKPDGVIAWLALNAGLRPMVGALAVLGAIFGRLTFAAVITVLACTAGSLAGRTIAMIRGAEPGLYTYAAIAIEVAITLLAAIALGSQEARPMPKQVAKG